MKANGSAELPVELQILELFSSGKLIVLGPTDVENLTGISKGTVSAKLRTMADAGYLQQVGKGRYQPGQKLFALAIGYLAVVMHHLDEVQAITAERVSEVQRAVRQLAGAFGGQTGEA